MYFLRKIAFAAFLTPFAFIQADVEEVIVTANKKTFKNNLFRNKKHFFLDIFNAIFRR